MSGGSAAAVDFRLRPAKQIERKMIMEAVRLCVGADTVRKYKYVGFGGVGFYDFRLAHRELGISDMLSYECNQEIALRQELNKPFRCIRTENVTADNLAVELDVGDAPLVVWLDFDGVVNDCDLDAVLRCVKDCAEGSIVIATFNAQKPAHDGAGGSDIDRITARLSRSRIPGWAVGRKQIIGSDFRKLTKEILDNTVRTAERERNRGSVQPVRAVQFLHFEYNDGPWMVTVAWRLVRDDEAGDFAANPVFGLPFACADRQAPKRLSPPVLTPPEVRRINSCLPLDSPCDSAPTVPGVSSEAIKKYIEVYRHYPAYFEAVTL